MKKFAIIVVFAAIALFTSCKPTPLVIAHTRWVKYNDCIIELVEMKGDSLGIQITNTKGAALDSCSYMNPQGNMVDFYNTRQWWTYVFYTSYNSPFYLQSNRHNLPGTIHLFESATNFFGIY